jgi:lipoprotein-anchoring transpeptidase ErfK/SrfK
MRGERVLRVSWVATVAALIVVLAAPTPSAPKGAGSEVPAPMPVVDTSRDPSIDAKPEPAPPARRDRFRPHALVRVPRPLTAFAHPSGRSRVVGTVVTSSKYYHVPMVVWVERLSRDRDWGLVELPYTWPRKEGWIHLTGLRRATTAVEVHVDLSRHWVSVFKRDERLFGFRAATGSRVSPTPPGHYVVTDRIPFARGSYLGSFAFGISGIQPRLPPGWSGGDQLAIHGTSAPSTIGTSASAGCLRVSEAALSRLKPLLRLGTPVLITR